uniref:Uncharacterized protein LOC104231689 n=1 Tax=Nicotiana sylvestris TaxID=4096 RepID=A0A1U7X044_NICSY|nr:PREDICTED: uncharacterized protein LOC104231689 [Nicotiana sylvestris]
MVEELEQVTLIEHLPDQKVYLGTMDPTGDNHSQAEPGPKFHPIKQKKRPQFEIKHAFIKDEVYEKVREKEFIDFIWDHIICRFGMPSKIVCDNGKQFIGNKVTKFIEDLKIKRIMSTPYHPSGNGQDKSNNKIILQNFKKRLTDAKGKWKEILPKVLWAYRTTSKFSTGATPFSLVCGAEALILVEIGEPSVRF